MVQTLVGRIAIVIPTYNSSTTVAETLKCLVDQGDHLRHVAAIYVADDCSSDYTPGIVRATWNCAVPLKILESNRNRGERSNVNRTVELIRDRADWILLLHSDDVAKEN